MRCPWALSSRAACRLLIAISGSSVCGRCPHDTLDNVEKRVEPLARKRRDLDHRCIHGRGKAGWCQVDFIGNNDQAVIDIEPHRLFLAGKVIGAIHDPQHDLRLSY